MDPRTYIEWIDQSDIAPLADIGSDDSPIFYCATTSDKGPEDLRLIRANDFNLYGEPNFKRHGQPLMQAKRLVDSGARVLMQRIVAPDATLANVIVTAKTTKSQEQKKNAQGQPLYLTPEGEETIVSTDNEPLMIDIVTIKFESSSVTGADSASAVDGQAQIGAGENTYPLFSIVDTGRGTSNKRIRMSPDYSGSKNLDFMLYALDKI